MKKLFKLFMSNCLMLIFGSTLLAQTTTPASPAPTQPSSENMVSLGDQVKMKIGGFLRADLYYDTRRNAEAVDGLFNFFPLPAQNDSFGKDINDAGQFRMAATASRINSKFSGPDVLNAKSSALIEFDFTGVNGIGARLRHAWVKLNWENSEFLFGRYWHPLFILDAFPTTLALSTGAPFSVFNRCEQIRYTMNFGSISVFGAASAQMLYGFPDTKQNQPIPDFSANIQFKNDVVIIGATGNIKTNQPVISYTASNKDICKTSDVVTSNAILGYAQVKFGDLKIKGSALYGENMHEFLMVGGYAIESIDTVGNIKYATSNTMNYWCNIIYGKDLQFSLFFGYLKNLGVSSKNVTSVSGRGFDIDNAIRIAPCITYKVGRILFQAELEQNIASYGKYKITDPVTKKDSYYNNAKVHDAKSYSNTRLQLTTTYMF